jgi:hypothetical protein
VQPVATTPEPAQPIRTGLQSPLDRKTPTTQAYEAPERKPVRQPTTTKRPEPEPVRPAITKPIEQAQPVASTGQILIKSAPPFAALTVNGKPQGETPMNSWMEVPVGKCHIEIVHRLTPPFDTTITVTAGSKQEFKFKLDR